MDGMQLRKLLILLITYSFFITSANAEFNTWTEYKSSNFRLYSDLDKAEVESALLEFEVFRATLIELLQLDKNKVLVPVDIYAFKSQKDYAKIQSNRNVAGYFQDTFRGPVMVLGPGKLRQINLSILYHEYLHYLVRANSSVRYPLWFNEGNAELYSSLEFDEDFVVVGNVAKRRAGKLANTDLIGIEKLLTQTNISFTSNIKTEQFYSTSWLLVHFLQFSSINGFDDYRASLAKYLNLYNKGIGPLTAFEQAFSVSLDTLQGQLEVYNRKRILNAQRIPKPQVTLNYQSKTLNQGQLYANMSHLAFSLSKRKTSEAFRQQAITLNSLQALSVESFLLVRKGETAKAIALLDKLGVTKNLDAEAYLNIGQAYKELITRMPEREDEMRRLAVYYLQQAKKLGQFSQTLVFLADLYWQAGDKQKAAEEIMGAVAIMPSNIRLNLIAGEYMVKLKNKKYAHFFLGNVNNWSKNPKQIKQAQTLLDSL
jgi:tetratricopeptide (TPR) repeat protein